MTTNYSTIRRWISVLRLAGVEVHGEAVGARHQVPDVSARRGRAASREAYSARSGLWHVQRSLVSLSSVGTRGLAFTVQRSGAGLEPLVLSASEGQAASRKARRPPATLIFTARSHGIQ